MEGAKILLTQSLKSVKQSFEPGHPNIARGQSNLARVLQDLGDLEGAKALLSQALATEEQNFEEWHPRVADSQYDLAKVLQTLGDKKRAHELLTKALAGFEKNFEPSHPRIRQVRKDLEVLDMIFQKPRQPMVFVSSAYLENMEQRRTVEKIVLQTHMHLVGMTRFSSSEAWDANELQLMIQQCDLFIGIVGHRYGWIPKGAEISVPELEYDFAKSNGVKCLMFEVDMAVPVDITRDMDQGQDRWVKQEKLEEFKLKYREEHTPTLFVNNTLEKELFQILSRWRGDESAENTHLSSSKRPSNLRLLTLELENISCFESIRLDFGSVAKSNKFKLILGDNSTGKSSLLRCIALALASPKDARAMLESTRTSWLRQTSKDGRIRLTVSDTHETTHSVDLRLTSATYGEILEVSHVDNTFRELVWEGPAFVCGYGPMRGSSGDSRLSKYSIRDATVTLFSTDAKLQNPELSLRRLLAENNSTQLVMKWLDHVLMLPDGATRLSSTGLELRSPLGAHLPVNAMSDGYRVTISWLADMLGWSMHHKESMRDDSVYGIVLLDELEQHLHPSWQRSIIQVLCEQFPNIQFVATTHAPLVVVGATALSDDEISLTVLCSKSDNVELVDSLSPPRGQRADQVLTSFLFGLPTSGDDKTKHQIERLAHLLSLPEPSATDTTEIQQLREELNVKLGSRESELEEIVSRNLAESTDELVTKKLEAANFETRRQIRNALSLGFPEDSDD